MYLALSLYLSWVLLIILLVENVKAENLQSPPTCNLCEHNFTMILATGRSGSTTLLEMVNQLPGFDLSGEQAGQFNDLLSLYKHFTDAQNLGRRSAGHGAWANRAEAENTFLCWIQGWYFAHTGSRNYNPSVTFKVHGFKEIRYNSPETLHFLKKVFPCGKFVVNYRNDLVKQHESKFHAHTSLKELGDVTENLINFSKEFPSTVYAMPLESFSNISLWNNLFSWLGRSNCKATDVAWANNHSYAADGRQCVECKGTLVY